MSIWKQHRSVDELNAELKGNMCEHVGMAITEVGDDYIKGTMPVDYRTRQHKGILHGGASVVLAETLGSIGAGMCCAPDCHTVGLDVNANHIRAGKPPLVTGVAKALHVGGSTMVWEIRITDVDGKLMCIARLTCAVLKKSK